MRNVVLHMQVTLDGFIADRGGGVDWAFPAFDDEFRDVTVAELQNTGVHIMGAETGRGLAAYWPSPHIDERDRPYADAMNRIPKVVFSKTIERLDWNSTRITRGELSAEIDALRHEDGKDILVHGGARFVQSLTRLGLINEYRLMVHPVVLGDGLRLFDAPLRLQLVEARQLRSGVVLHVSRPAR